MTFIHDGNMSLFNDNQEMILSIVRTLTTDGEFVGSDIDPAEITTPAQVATPTSPLEAQRLALENDIIGRWMINDFPSDEWFIGGEIIEFFANGTGIERFGNSEWDFIWWIEIGYGWDGPEMFETLHLWMVYNDFELLYIHPAIWGNELRLNPWVPATRLP